MRLKLYGKFFILFLSGFATGLFLTVQWRTQPSRVTSPILPYTSLRKARDILQAENNTLKEKISLLQNQINQNQLLLKKAKVADAATLEELEHLKERIALTPLSGQGVRIYLADSTSTPATPDTIVHAADLRDLINLLWAAGAKGLAINNQRVSTFTAIDCIVNTILVNNARLTSPFEINAIGDPAQLIKYLADPVNLPDIHRRRKLGLKFEVEKVKEIQLPAFNGSYTIQFAHVAK